VVRVDATHAVCRVHISETTRFLAEGRVPAALSLEYMAQAMGVHAGYHQKVSGQEVKRAFLLSCRKLDLQVPHFELGDVLDVEAELVWGGEGEVGVFSCRVLREGQVVASGRLNAFQGELDGDQAV